MRPRTQTGTAHGRQIAFPAPGDSKRKPGEALRVSDWHTLPEADLVVRRRQVWGLLEWYHRTQVVPQLGLKGMLRRFWNRVTGKGYMNLSVFDRLHLTMLIARREAERVAAEQSAAPAEGAPAEEAKP